MGRHKKPVAEPPPVDNEHVADGAERFAPEVISVNAKQEGVTVTFIGDPRGGKDPEVSEYGGKSFPKGRTVEVEAEWLKANANIRKNNHFKVE